MLAAIHCMAMRHPTAMPRIGSSCLQDKEAAEAQNAELQAELRQLQEEREAERPQVRMIAAV